MLNNLFKNGVSIYEDEADKLNQIGCGYEIARDYETAVEFLENAAQAGNAEAMAAIVLHYSVDKNDEFTAFKWYKKAAAAGHVESMSNLAYCYRLGQGVSEDDFEAFKWFKKAANAGDASAMCNLADAYEYGRGVQQDIKEAFKWYEKAAKTGDLRAMEKFASNFHYGSPSCPQDYDKALYWYNKAVGRLSPNDGAFDLCTERLKSFLDEHYRKFLK